MGVNMKKKKTKLNMQNIFILASIIFLFILIIIYSSRLVYYYNKGNEKPINITDLSEKIKNKTVKKGDGLYIDNNNYYFKGKNVNNYVIYSNLLWRIVKLENNQVTLISEKPLANLYFDNYYKDSIINEYLTNNIESILDNRLIVDTKTCINNILDNKDDCIEEYNAKVVLPSLSLYEKAGGINSFINNKFYTYLSNGAANNFYYIDDLGAIGNTKNIYLYGLKPIITIKSTDVVSGDGSKEHPFALDDKVSLLSDANVGSYIHFSNKLWRIVKNNDSTRLILNDTIAKKEFTDIPFSMNKGIGKYLNTIFYNELDKTYIIKSNWYNGTFDKNTNYLFNKVSAYVGLPNILELFVNDVGNHALINNSRLGETVFEIKNNGVTYKNITSKEYGIRPMVNIKNNLKITGLGTIDNPYMIEGESK